jgi:hypothetical protein
VKDENKEYEEVVVVEVEVEEEEEEEEEEESRVSFLPLLIHQLRPRL